MNKRFLSVVAFALVVSGLVSLLIYRMIYARLAVAPKAASARILVASHGLPLGTLVREADMKVAEWYGPTPSSAIVKPEDALGRGVVADIYEGEPLLETRLAPRGAGAGLAAIIPKGMRAVALRVDEVVGVAGFVVPGMRVDVLVSGNAPGTRNDSGTQTRTVLQSLEVLSAGQNIQKDAEGKPVSVTVVNLAVTPEQAETLSLASHDTKVQLILRNPLDRDEVKTPGTALARLFGAEHTAPRPQPRPAMRPAPPPPPQAAVVPVFKVEVLHGAKKTEVKFQTTSEAQQ